MSDLSSDDQDAGWPFPAALNISAPSWQSDFTRQGQVTLIRPRMVIGSDPTGEIVILDSGAARRHAAISWTADGYQIEDLGSVTGTWIGGKRIFQPAALTLGDSIRIGSAILLFTTPLGEQTTAVPAAAPTHLATPAAPNAQPAPASTPPLDESIHAASAPPMEDQHTPAPTQRPATVPVRTPIAATVAPAPQEAQPAYATPPSRPQPPAQQQPIYAPPLPQPAPPPVERIQQPIQAQPAPAQLQPVSAQPIPAQPNAVIQPQPVAPPSLPPSGQLAAGLATAPKFDLGTWLQAQQPRFYWKFFLIGLAVLIAAEVTASSTSNFIPVMMIILLYSALAPITFVIFFWEQGKSVAELSPIVLVAAFGCGGTVGLIVGSTLDGVLNANANGLIPALLIGVAEETGKVAALFYFMRDLRLRKEINGLLLGAASGMGFAALETSGYGFVAFVQGLVQGGTFGGALNLANQQLLSRMLLAIFGHGVWTAIICSAIWRERGSQAFAATRGVVIAFVIAICLHGLWDFSIGQGWLPLTIGDGVYPGFDILIVGPLGLIILSFFLREAIQQARQGPDAPPPPPLDDALKAYFNAIFAVLGRVFGGTSRPAPPAQPYGAGGYPYPPQGQPGPYAPPPPMQNGVGNSAQPYPQQPPQQQQQPQPYAPPPPQRQAAPYRQSAPRPAQPLPPAQAPAPQWPLAQEEQAQKPPVWPLPQQQRQAAPHPLATVPYCTRCGITYPPGVTICTNCGSPLTEGIGH